MIEHHLDIPTADGAMSAFVVHPDEGGPFPVVLFYMDAPGKREELHDMARRLAAVGYCVLLPNLYYRRSRDFSLKERTEPAMAEMFALMADWCASNGIEHDVYGSGEPSGVQIIAYFAADFFGRVFRMIPRRISCHAIGGISTTRVSDRNCLRYFFTDSGSGPSGVPRLISNTPIWPLLAGGWSPGRRWVCQVIARLTVGSGFVSGQSPSPGRGVAKMCGSYAVRK